MPLACIAWFLRKREREPEDVTIGFPARRSRRCTCWCWPSALATEWSSIGSAQQAVGNEAVAVRQLYWAASGLPEPAASNLEAQVSNYLNTVINHDLAADAERHPG